MKFGVAPGLGCLQNKRLLALLVNLRREVSPSARSPVKHNLNYACAMVRVNLAAYFYAAWVACWLVPASRVDPEGLPPGTLPDC